MTEVFDPSSSSGDENDRLDPNQWFREGASALDSPLWWQLNQQAELVEALRTMCSGAAAVVQLRIWVFLELMTLPEGKVSRETLRLHFHLLRDEALELALRPLRSTGILEWDAQTSEYAVTPLASRLMPLLSPLANSPDEDAELAGLLALVAGGQQLGTLQPAQVRHLQAQLERLHDEFSDAISSGSEFNLRRAKARHERVFELINRASQVLAAITASAGDVKSAWDLARQIARAQAKLLAMKSQFDRALHQADRRRVTLGSTGVTTSDVRLWLQRLENLSGYLGEAVSVSVRPPFVLGHELVDVAEAEFERERTMAQPEELPEALAAPSAVVPVQQAPRELQSMIQLLGEWSEGEIAVRPASEVVFAGEASARFAVVAYRTQLLPLLGDPRAQRLLGPTRDVASLPWRIQWSDRLAPVTHEHVSALSAGWIRAAGLEPVPDDLSPIPFDAEGHAAKQ
jgi:hypothetical protein